MNAPTDYGVTRDGQVFSFKHKKPLALKSKINRWGYYCVRLYTNGRSKEYRIHCLVAHYFLPPRPSLLHQIRHLNGIKTDNRDTNLKWGTAAENAADRSLHGHAYRPDWKNPENHARWSAAYRAGHQRRREMGVSRKSRRHSLHAKPAGEAL